MKVQTKDLIGIALDWAVAQAEGNVRLQYDSREGLVINNILGWIAYRPSVAWIQGGPIIEREAIDLFTEKHAYPESWCASVAQYQNGQRLVGWRLHKYGPTPLVAAMRCFVASKLGDEVEIPEELL